MLTADLVRARRKAGELLVQRLSPKERPRALELAEAYLGVARASVGQTREELFEALRAVPIAPRERRLADGLQKLVEDGAEFSAVSDVDPVELRGALFLAASAARKGNAGPFDRDAVIRTIAAERGLSPEALEKSLYSDLKGEQILTAAPPKRAPTLVDEWDAGQVQAVLLRAVRVTAEVTCRDPSLYRALFRELKFRRLLYRIHAEPSGGYRIDLDGPFSLFESVTKYGLSLALSLPALEACDSLVLVAEVRWGKERKPLTFRHAHRRAEGASSAAAPAMREDVETLLRAFQALETPWRAAPCTEILDLPGIGVCVPDLVFQRGKERVYFEALGFWSRDAVWKRVELAERGLRAKVLFAVSSRLRVSEAVLEESETAALYVYKGVMSARSVERKLDELAGLA
ncbi:MAG TPA: DUF790 family protein [Polyangiaceae bacterium]|nr:DUF790 family protein [Polyangiaceae bacterium]